MGAARKLSRRLQSFRDSLQGWRRRRKLLASFWERFLSLIPAEPFPLGRDALQMVNLNLQPPRSSSTTRAEENPETPPLADRENMLGKGGRAPCPGEPRGTAPPQPMGAHDLSAPPQPKAPAATSAFRDAYIVSKKQCDYRNVPSRMKRCRLG